jgi:hypothetical protein
MAKLKISQTNSQQNVTYPQGRGDKFVSPTLIGGYPFGGVGGLTSQSGLQIQPQVYVNAVGGGSAAGSIIAQKGSHKFRVTDGTRTGTCQLVNSPNLTAGQMNILITLSTVTASVASANVAGGATSTYVTWSGTPTGVYATPRVGDYIIGFAGNAAVARVTAINTASNVTIATGGNVGAQSSIAGVTNNTYASKITNKFVYDFTSDGQPDSTNGTITFMTSGYNPNKYRYVLGAGAGPNATFVKVQSL